MESFSGKKSKEYLTQMGIATPLDVLNHLPRRYDVFLYTDKAKLIHLQDKEKVVLFGHVVGAVRTLRFAKASSTQFYFEDEGGQLYTVRV